MLSPWPEIKALVIGVGGGCVAWHFTKSLVAFTAAAVVVTVAAHRRSGPRWGRW